MITAWKWNDAFLPKNGGAMYGWFFWMWIAIMAVECILLLPVAAKHKEKTTDRVVLCFVNDPATTEIYKQIFFTVENGTYPWNLFPWQFCSVPMFLAVIAPLLRKGRVKDALYKFLAFFGLIAGIMTLLIPEGFYWDYVTITCHSFMWHTSIVVVSLYLIVANGYAKKLGSFVRECVPAFIVYTAVVLIALVLNVLWWYLLSGIVPEGMTFSMFYISPFFNSSLPVFRDVQPMVPYPVFLAFYVVSFCIGAAAVWFATLGIRKIFRKRKAEK